MAYCFGKREGVPTSVLTFHVSYFSVMVLKHHDEGNLQKEGCIGAYGSREIRIYHGGGGVAQREQEAETF